MSQLDEIQARADAATEGPWAAAKSADGHGKKVLGPRQTDDLGQGLVTLMKPVFWNAQSARNAEFIAHAREDVPKLVAALRAVEAVHEPVDALMFGGRSQQHKVRVCTGCGSDDGNWNQWPCPTITAIREALG